MVMSTVGYPEYDPHNKVPAYCSKCGKKLRDIDGIGEYNIYTGIAIGVDYLACPTLISWHDHWKKESYGAWVNHAIQG